MNAPEPPAAEVKVSVAMITYNHEQFIMQAIDSVLMQQTDFAVELVIGEDCSTDGTRAMVRDYGERHADRIRLLLPERNLGMFHNFAATLEACRGQYIALLEGDDYWTDPRKLQKQVDFLEAHSECSMCFHDVLVEHEDHRPPAYRQCAPDQKAISTLEDLLRGNFLPTPSVVYRNGLFGDLPGWYSELAVADWPLHILNAQYGQIGYIAEAMGVYRIHAGGVWSWRDSATKIKQMLPLYGHLYNHLDATHRSAVSLEASKAIAAGAAAILETGGGTSLTPSLDFVRSALASGAEAGFVDRHFRRMTWARTYQALGFTAHRRGDMLQTRKCFTRALALDPALARNYGILSLCFEAYFGEEASTMRKKATRRFLGH
jgi:glycosyltransferase involved in cell wall biosynthesis